MSRSADQGSKRREAAFFLLESSELVTARSDSSALALRHRGTTADARTSLSQERNERDQPFVQRLQERCIHGASKSRLFAHVPSCSLDCIQRRVRNLHRRGLRSQRPIQVPLNATPNRNHYRPHPPPTQQPKKQQPKPQPPTQEARKEEPKKEAPKQEAKKEEPKKEAPKQEAKKEEPKKEEKKEEKK